MATQLPPELIREVSRNLSRSRDAKTLRSGSLVSSAFRGPCQEVIFSKINIRKRHLDEDNSAHHLAGLEIFRQNSALVSYVRAVSIKNATGCHPFVFDATPMAPCTVELIKLLSTQYINSFVYVAWVGPIGDGFEDAIINLVGSPQLRTLTLASVPLELCRFIASPSLKTLGYRQGLEHFHPPLMIAERLSQSPSAAKTRSTAPIRLELHAEPPIIENLSGTSSVIDLRSVKFLKFTSNGPHRGNIWIVLTRCAPALRTLNISTENMEINVMAGSLASEALGRLVKLRELEIVCGDYFGREEAEEANNPYPGLAPFLNALPSPSSISNMRIRVRFGGWLSLARGKRFWDGIDRILCCRSRFPKLKTLQFSINLSRDLPLENFTSEEYEEEERVYWAACQAAGIKVNLLYTAKLHG